MMIGIASTNTGKKKTLVASIIAIWRTPGYGNSGVLAFGVDRGIIP